MHVALCNTQHAGKKIVTRPMSEYFANDPDARFYELGLTRELTNPRVGVIPSLILVYFFCVLSTFSNPVLTNSSLTCTSLVS